LFLIVGKVEVQSSEEEKERRNYEAHRKPLIITDSKPCCKANTNTI
jgi:hypothetical protein